MVKYSPAGSEGEDSCAYVSCMYGTYWDGSACRDCPEDTYLGFETYSTPTQTTGTVFGIATYNENRASPMYGDGTGNEDLCLPCGTLDVLFSSSLVQDVAGSTQGVGGAPQCDYASVGG